MSLKQPRSASVCPHPRRSQPLSQSWEKRDEDWAARAIVFNADDFGLTNGVNAGNVEAHREGLVTAASLMVTTPGLADALELARANPALDLGVHLTLTGVPPALDPGEIPSLVEGGRFRPLGAQLAALLLGWLDLGQVRRELRAQLERALASGLGFSHLDGHHHVHLLPGIAPIVGELAREYGIPFVRRVPKLEAGTPCGPAQVAKRLLLRGADARAAAAFQGLRRLDAFRGVPFPAGLDGWRRLLGGLPPGVTELMCHPGRHDPAVRAFDPLVAERAVELAWLCRPGPRALLEQYGIEPRRFVDLERAA